MGGSMSEGGQAIHEVDGQRRRCFPFIYPEGDQVYG